MLRLLGKVNSKIKSPRGFESGKPISFEDFQSCIYKVSRSLGSSI